MDAHDLGDTVYFWFAANLVTGAAGDGSAPTFAVRKAGAASSAAPVLTGTPTLLSHASYSDGSYEIAVAATSGNGFEADATYAVFCSLTISSITPNGYVGSFSLTGTLPTADDIDTVLSASHGDGSWEGSGGGNDESAVPVRSNRPKAGVWQFRVMEDSGCAIMGRVRNPNGQYITQSTLTSVAVTYRSIIPSGNSTTSSLTVADCVFNSLQTDARWTKDSLGYNFRWDVPATIFTRGGGQYGVTFLFTPLTGAPYKVTCRLDVQGDEVG